MAHQGDSPGHNINPEAGRNPHSKTGCAPNYDIPQVPFVGVEHPCIIRNIERGIQSLGGLRQITKLATHTERTARLSLHPDNPESTLIKSAKVQTDNIVLKFIVPKKTGLKRKRGSSGPFQHMNDDAAASSNGSTTSADKSPAVHGVSKPQDLLQSLQDNADRYQVELVGHIEETHRFRDMPDFAFSTTNSPFMSQMRDKIMPFDLLKMKEFKMDLSRGPKPKTDIIPPPWLSTMGTPFNYAYLENPYVSTTENPTGQTISRNRSLPSKQYNQHTPLNAPHVPMGPSPHLAPLESHEPAMRRLIIAARELITKRPIYTRRAMFNSLSRPDLIKVGQNATKHIQQYIGYMFEGGPWGAAIIRFGVDPRKNSKYRIYQTLVFQLETEPVGAMHGRKDNQTRRDMEIVKNMGEQADSHIFDGKKVYTEGKMWQLCDITDPLLAQLIATKELRDRCHLWYDGWYHNASLARVRAIMRKKMMMIQKGETVSDDLFESALQLPPIYKVSTARLFKAPRAGKDELEQEQAKLVEQIRMNAGRSASKPLLGELDESDEAAWRHKEQQEEDNVNEMESGGQQADTGDNLGRRDEGEMVGEEDVSRKDKGEMVGQEDGSRRDEDDMVGEEEPGDNANDPLPGQRQLDSAVGGQTDLHPASMGTGTANLTQSGAENLDDGMELD